MGTLFKFLIAILILAGLGALVVYFVSEPDLRTTERDTKKFHEAAAMGVSLASALHSSPNFRSVTFGNCGKVESSPDSGPKGSLIFSPAKGEFARYTSFDEFVSRNPRLLSDHEECRHVFVQYVTIFPVRGSVELLLDGQGLIVKKSAPVIFQ